jgi:hypothetical protein
LGHVSDAESICERRQTDEYKKWNPDPELLDRAEEQNKDDAVEDGGDVSIGDSEGSGERCISNGFASLAKDRAPEMLHGTALVEAYIEHGCCAGGSEYIGEESRGGMYCVGLHCSILPFCTYLG